jgi:superfamily II DNA or RNA helicase
VNHQDVIAKLERWMGEGSAAVLREREARVLLDRLRELEAAAGAAGYEAYVGSKLTTPVPTGFAEDPELADFLFPFQREIVRAALRRGRCAIFADTGLGKTAMQLEWARVVSELAGPVLILAPLAVAQQTMREGAAFGIEVRYARDQGEAGDARIVITNYERLHRFTWSRWAGVVLDESSILKSYMGKTKRTIIEAFAATPFKLACTATPAPNDHLELGNHAEFLGVMTSHEMIARWFIADQSAFGTYRLKGHAIRPFWDWVSSWAVCCTKPSDLGDYSDEGYDLPELRLVPHVLDVDLLEERGELLFRLPELTATSIHKEKRRTVEARAQCIAERIAAEPDESWIVWCDTDYEADALAMAIPGCTEVRGSHPAEAKEQAALDFVDGKISVLVSKPSIFGWGLNWQHVARMAFVGATYSYEAFYQAVRRSWRFGQTRPVHVHVALAQTELGIWATLSAKRDGHDEMREQMRAAMRRRAARESPVAVYDPTQPMELPEWLTKAA